MKRLGVISAGVLLLVLGTITPAYAQQDQQNAASPPIKVQQSKPEKRPPDRNKQSQDNRKQQQRNKGEQVHAPPQDHSKDQQQHAQEQNHSKQQQWRRQPDSRFSPQGQRVERGEQRKVWQQHRAQNWQSEHRDWRQRGGYSGYRIPDDHYRGSLGADHSFHIHRYPMELYGGHPRFWYDGFWFGFMDPWPEHWADDWYDNDDVYI